MTETETYTLDEDEVAILKALKAEVNRWNRPVSVEALADAAEMGVNRARRAVRRLVELRLARKSKGSYGRVRYDYDLTGLGAVSQAGR